MELGNGSWLPTFPTMIGVSLWFLEILSLEMGTVSLFTDAINENRLCCGGRCVWFFLSEILNSLRFFFAYAYQF